MNRQDLEERTKEFALEIIRLLSNLPKKRHLTAEDGRGKTVGSREKAS